MRWQVAAGIAVASLLTVAPASATVIDFATDPNLAADWTEGYFYDFDHGGPGGTTAAWNAGNRNLDLTSNHDEAAGLLYLNGSSRYDSDAVTVTFTDFTGTMPSGGWMACGLIVSANQALDIFDSSPSYEFYFQQDASGAYFAVGKNGLTPVGDRHYVAAIPGTMKLDVKRDGAFYVFKANGEEIGRDATYAYTPLRYYSLYWGSGAANTFSVSADNFGTIVLKPFKNPIDFAADPHLATDWTSRYFYDPGVPGYGTSVSWNESNQNLDLTSNHDEALGLLYINGATRGDTNAVTVTLTGFTATGLPAGWAACGLIVSANQALTIFDGSPAYEFFFQQDNGGPYYAVYVNASVLVAKRYLEGVPGTMKLDVKRDGAFYVFMANGEEIGRDATFASTPLHYYSLYWGSGEANTFSASADNFGTVIPPMGTLVTLQ